jgi:hypothetical protein
VFHAHVDDHALFDEVFNSARDFVAGLQIFGQDDRLVGLEHTLLKAADEVLVNEIVLENSAIRFYRSFQIFLFKIFVRNLRIGY